MINRKFFIFIAAICFSLSLFAQNETEDFLKTQLAFPHVSAAWKKYNDTLRKEFLKKNLAYPPKDIFIRVFKSQNELELWGRNSETADYKLVKLFHVCALSGILGPKRAQGDLQVPEGLYFVDDFNPQSKYYLSLLLNYPNFSDTHYFNSLESDRSSKIGGDIYIHGGCVTIGCIPITDEGIKQLYVICLNAKSNGQENIPIHVYPTRFTKSGCIFLKREYGSDIQKLQFWNDLKEHYDYFERNHVLLPVMYTPDGKYVY